jgi:anti-sigma-K factor RskA
VTPPDDASIARRYLLGQLADADRDAFEARILDDAAVGETVAAVEGDLLDEYADGALPPAARARIDARVAADPGLRDRLALAGALRTIAARRAPAPIRAPRWWTRASFAVAIAAAAVIALVVVERGGPNRDGVVAVELPPTTRDSAVVELDLRAHPERVRLRLSLAPAPALHAELRGPDGPVPVSVVDDGPHVAIELAAAPLRPGLYDVTVTIGADVVQRSQLRVRD